MAPKCQWEGYTKRADVEASASSTRSVSLSSNTSEMRVSTQEFVLRWSPDGGRSFREIVRQQWNFSSPNTISEIEQYRVELSDVTVLELVIVPDISRGAARASLKNLRLS